MHECLSVQGWIRAWGGSDAANELLESCPRCSTHRDDPDTWVRAVSECGRCRSALESIPLDDPEVLNCPECMEAFATLHKSIEELEHFDPVVAPEALAADELLAKLAPLSPAGQVARVTDDSRYQQWGLVQALLASARELWLSDPRTGHDRAKTAVAVADLLDPEIYHPQWTADLRAKAYAYLGNTHRVLGAFAEAERAFHVAEHHLRHGVGGGRARAQVFSLKASLLIDQQRLVEAQALLDAVLAFHRAAEDAQAVARIHLKRALVAGRLGEWGGALEEANRAREHLDPERDDRLFALALQNSVEYLLHDDAVTQARRTFDELPPPSDRWMELRRLWIEGNLLRAEEAHGAARVAYEAARKGFAEDGNHYQAGLVSLDLAALALDLGDPVEAFEIAEQASVLLVRGAARQEALAALRLLLTSLEQGVADRAFVLNVARRIASYKPAR